MLRNQSSRPLRMQVLFYVHPKIVLAKCNNSVYAAWKKHDKRLFNRSDLYYGYFLDLLICLNSTYRVFLFCPLDVSGVCFGSLLVTATPSSSDKSDSDRERDIIPFPKIKDTTKTTCEKCVTFSSFPLLYIYSIINLCHFLTFPNIIHLFHNLLRFFFSDPFLPSSL